MFQIRCIIILLSVFLVLSPSVFSDYASQPRIFYGFVQDQDYDKLGNVTLTLNYEDYEGTFHQFVFSTLTRDQAKRLGDIELEGHFFSPGMISEKQNKSGYLAIEEEMMDRAGINLSRNFTGEGEANFSSFDPYTTNHSKKLLTENEFNEIYGRQDETGRTNAISSTDKVLTGYDNVVSDSEKLAFDDDRPNLTSVYQDPLTQEIIAPSDEKFSFFKTTGVKMEQVVSSKQAYEKTKELFFGKKTETKKVRREVQMPDAPKASKKTFRNIINNFKLISLPKLKKPGERERNTERFFEGLWLMLDKIKIYIYIAAVIVIMGYSGFFIISLPKRQALANRIKDKIDLTLGEVATKDSVVFAPGDGMKKIIRLMINTNIDSVLIMDNRYRGLITKQIILGNSYYKDIGKQKAGNYLSYIPPVDKDTPAISAGLLRKRHIPIVTNNVNIANLYNLSDELLEDWVREIIVKRYKTAKKFAKRVKVLKPGDKSYYRHLLKNRYVIIGDGLLTCDDYIHYIYDARYEIKSYLRPIIRIPHYFRTEKLFDLFNLEKSTIYQLSNSDGIVGYLSEKEFEKIDEEYPIVLLRLTGQSSKSVALKENVKKLEFLTLNERNRYYVIQRGKRYYIVDLPLLLEGSIRALISRTDLINKMKKIISRR